MTIQIKLSPEVESILKWRVESGHYQSVDDVVHSALLLLEDYESQLTSEVEALRKLIEEGIASGPPRPFDPEVFLERRKSSRLTLTNASDW